jgi:hypothetical protein
MTVEIAAGAMTVEIVVGVTVLPAAVAVQKANLPMCSLRPSRLFCRVNRCRSIGAEKVVRRSKVRLMRLRRRM